MSEFSDWLDKSIKAHGGVRKVGRYSDLSAPTLSDLARGHTRPKYDTCLKLARYFKLSPRRVLRMAGLEVIEPQPTPSLEVASPRLQMCLSRLVVLSEDGQDWAARMFAPIVEHIEWDDEFRTALPFDTLEAAHIAGRTDLGAEVPEEDQAVLSQQIIEEEEPRAGKDSRTD